MNVPFRCLTSSPVSLRLFCFFAKPGRAIRVLLSDRLSIRQVLRSINNYDQCSDLWTVNGHIRVDPRCMHAVEAIGFGDLGSHD